MIMKMKIKHILIAFALFVVSLMTGCQRVALECDYTIIPKVELYSGGPGNTPSDWTAYAFYGTAEDFHISEYFDSIAMGQLWNRKKGEYVLCNAQAMQRGGGNIVLPLHATKSIIVVCAPEYKVFAWKEATITENLWNLQIPIWLRVWRGSNYKEAAWQFVFPPKEEPQP